MPVESFTWPAKEDVFETVNDDIILRIRDIVPSNNRGHFGISHSDMKKVKSAMVLYLIKFNNFLKIISKTLMDEWIDGLMDGWMDGSMD